MESIVISATLPRQASCCKAAWVPTDRRVNFPPIDPRRYRVALGVEAIELPAPARRVMIEAEQPFFGERRNELNSEKRIAARLLVHQLSQRGGMAGVQQAYPQ